MADRPSAAIGDRLANELDAVRQRIEELALPLCLDPVVFERHPEPLQAFDQLGQVIDEVARMLRHTGPLNDAISAVRLGEMRERLICEATKTKADERPIG